MEQDFDIIVVGGGINGAAIARDAAGRGARVLLVEQDDLAAHTSSASTKLIHGGLRYLEQYEFRLVRESLAERERLIHAAPHLVRPLRFILPHDSAMRPAWMIRAGLFLYDRLGGKSSLPGSIGVRLDRTPSGNPLQSRFRRGFAYSDCWGDDSRLVVANARDARNKGATVLTRTALLQASRTDRGWRALISLDGGQCRHVTSKILVNATGAWAANFLPARAGVGKLHTLQLVKGSHIVTRRLWDGDHAYIFQNPDNRIVFAIPFEDRFTLIGTTDVRWHKAPDQVEIEESEIDYLCQALDRWLEKPISPRDVLWSFAGLRALVGNEADPSQLSRDYVLEIDDSGGSGAPLLSVFGGKITTHRALADHAMDMLARYLADLGDSWTSGAKLPGGDLGAGGLDGLVAELREIAPQAPTALLTRWARSYGSDARKLAENAAITNDYGNALGGLTEAEVDYLISEEWAKSVDDILWRRSKQGLHATPEQVECLEALVRSRLTADSGNVASQIQLQIHQ